VNRRMFDMQQDSISSGQRKIGLLRDGAGNRSS
jgi:hypothetical protein